MNTRTILRFCFVIGFIIGRLLGNFDNMISAKIVLHEGNTNNKHFINSLNLEHVRYGDCSVNVSISYYPKSTLRRCQIKNK